MSFNSDAKPNLVAQEATQIEGVALEHLKLTGKLSAVRGNYRLNRVKGKMSVKWKAELVKRRATGLADEITRGAQASIDTVLRITPPQTVPSNLIEKS